MNENIVNDYINECITIYENTINKISKKDINILKTWVSDIESENTYEKIDSLFDSNVLTIENKITNRRLIAESLKKTQTKSNDIINLPISSMVNLANKTINNYIENLNESDKQDLINFLNTNEKDMEKSYQEIKENVLKKLNNMSIDSDLETKQKIEESISKIKTEKFDKLNFFKLKSLNESL
jgi:hypothetical protein